MKIYFLPLVAFLVSCASVTETTGESGVSMGDSYEKVLEKVKANNKITKMDGSTYIVAEGYWSTSKDCRVKYFIFQDKDGLQQVRYQPAPNLSVKDGCR
jgi:effector-binding domain-containing protein